MKPKHDHSAGGPVDGHDLDDEPPPRDNVVVWVVVVGAILLAVPLLSEWINSTPRAGAQRVAQHAAKASAEPAQSAASAASPAAPDPGAPPPREAVPTVPAPPADRARQFVTKCIENGRIVYTQSAICPSGSMSIVTVEPDKNVVGGGQR
ncbi:MAG: hypothetical protein HS128_05645 [Ideonella sp.]|nr:hypothetical protein [Ideonella sp.]MCC7458430.1 hypothetical protein [Nitrospira sp.]